jgi:hypothetical protein
MNYGVFSDSSLMYHRNGKYRANEKNRYGMISLIHKEFFMESHAGQGDEKESGYEIFSALLSIVSVLNLHWCNPP